MIVQLTGSQETKVFAMQSFTYFLHFNDKRVNVVPGIVVVQVLLVTLHFPSNEVQDSVEMAEHFVVRTWHVLHHSRECLIQLLGRKQ